MRAPTAFLLILSLFPGTAGRPKIIPLRTIAVFSAQSRENQWSVPIQSTAGGAEYVLSLEPDFDIGHHVIALELVLRRPNGKRDSPNLFDPTGKRHGLQDYDFAADDLAHGAQNSVFGKVRILYLETLYLAVRIEVSKATVSPFPQATIN